MTTLPTPQGQAATACRALVAALPDTVSGEERMSVEPASPFVAAWGDPPIVLRCGVAKPRGLNRFSTCQVANGVGWFVPESAFDDQEADVVMTTVGFAQYVEVRLPGEYRPPAAAMADLAGPIKGAIREVRPCV